MHDNSTQRWEKQPQENTTHQPLGFWLRSSDSNIENQRPDNPSDAGNYAPAPESTGFSFESFCKSNYCALILALVVAGVFYFKK